MDNLKEYRKKILLTALRGGGGHIASSYSSLEIIWSLYQGGVLRVDPLNPKWDGRDRFILSKGHAALALYVCLSKMGFFDDVLLDTFTRPGGILGGEPLIDIAGVETASGSLGHGLSYGIGLALGIKKNNKDSRVFVLVGDGECQEGSVWEAVGIASRLELDNLTVILDNNGIQKMDYINNICGEINWKSRWESFGWYVVDVDGHDTNELINILGSPNENEKPKLVIANTVKGKGVSIMENKIDWHYKLPNKKEWKTICQELDIMQEEIDNAKILR